MNRKSTPAAAGSGTGNSKSTPAAASGTGNSKSAPAPASGTGNSNLEIYKDFLTPEFQHTFRKLGFEFEDGQGQDGDMDETTDTVGSGGGTWKWKKNPNQGNGASGTAAGAGYFDKETEAKMAKEKSERTIAEFEKIMHDFPDTYRDYDFTQPTVTPTILNVVASVTLGFELDLKEIQRKIANVELDPRSFASCVLRIKNPRSTCTVFASGKLNLQCTHNIEDCKLAARKFVGLIKKAGYKLPEDRKPGYRVTNITAKVTLPWPMNLRELSAIEMQKKEDEMRYEPEVFPGLVWTSQTPKCKAAIFANGDVLYTGPYKFTIKNDQNELIFNGEVGYKRTASIWKGNPGAVEPTLAMAIKHIQRSDDVLNKDSKKSTHFTICTGTYETLLGSCSFSPELTDENTIFKSEIDGRTCGFELVKNPDPETNNAPSPPVAVDTSAVTKDKPPSPDTEINIVSNGRNYAKLIIPTGKTWDFDAFDCSIEFSESVKGEKAKEFVLGVAVAYLLCRNGNIMTPGQHKFWAGVGILFALGIIAGIIVGIVYLISYLNDNCNRPGYHCGNRRYVG